MTIPKNIQKLLLTFIFILTPVMCVYAQTNKSENKEEERTKEYKSLVQLVESGQYQFVGEKAFPRSGRQIDITTRSNFDDI